MHISFISTQLTLWLACCVTMCFSHSDLTSVLMISFDGFRWDYLEKVKAAGNSTPNFDKLIQEGVTTHHGGVKNAFITKTFPNHYTIVTGLYEESHGVIHNSYFDPIYNETFRNTQDQNMDPKWWDNGDAVFGPEPIWITNEKGSEFSQFPKRSGVYFWPGSQAPTNGKYPTHYQPYDPTVKYETRINKVIQWFSTEEMPINLGLLYFDEPDKTGHEFGPNSPEMIDRVVALDELVGYLLHQLEEHHLYSHMNLIITSDHGMKEMIGTVYLDESIDPDDYTHYGSSPVWLIEPEEGKKEEIYEKLQGVEHLQVFKKEEIPEKFHYSNNRRVTSIVVMAEEGYGLCHNASNCYHEKGNHGYSNEDAEMHNIFIAHGPKFKCDFQADPFESVDIYPLLCHILDVDPAPNNGSLERILDIIYVYDNKFITLATYTVVLGSCGMMSLVCCFFACRAKKGVHSKRYATVIMSDLPDNDNTGKTHLLSGDNSFDSDEEIP